MTRAGSQRQRKKMLIIIIVIIIIIIVLLIWKMTQLHNSLKLQKTLVTMCFYKHLCQRGLWFR
jgi:cytochrome oxidase assembly protein ShyY1